MIRTSILLLVTGMVWAQEYSASLSVAVSDPSDAVVPKAHIALTDNARKRTYEQDTSSNGLATLAPLPPGDYSLEVTKPGFQKLEVPNVTLAVRDQKNLSVQLVVASGVSSVTVSATPETVTTDASMGISVDQSYIENLPLNGRNIDALVLMAPGVTSAFPGDFNVNGLRSNTNYYTLDGVSLNGSVGGGGPPGFGGPGIGGFGGGAPPGGAAGGSGTSSVNIESLQEMRVQTSSFAPEFGRSPGAQISMTSRGGSDIFHGALYEYFRNEDLDANDWFANSRGYGRAETRQNRIGGTLGGPLIKNRTYFFVAYEHLGLMSPSTLITSVPDLRTRESAPPAMRPFLNAFPLPNGPEQTDGAAEYHALLSNPSRTDSASLRIDHTLTNNMTIFARYSLIPSSSTNQGGFSSANTLTHLSSNSQNATAGLTRTSDSGWVNDLRFNYSRFGSRNFSTMDNFGGATPLTASEVFPSGVSPANSQFSLNVLGIGGYSFGGETKNLQSQINLVDSLTKAVAKHTFKVGLDYRRTMPTYFRDLYTLSATFNGVGGSSGSLQTGEATSVQIASNLPAVYPVYMNFSAYAQDTWRATDRTTITYGLRWDVNPAPGVRKGPTPLALSDDVIAGVTQNTGLYATRWLNVAPRFGLAYLMDNTPGKELMVRMGGGIFYDVGYGASASAFNGAPYSNVRTISLANFPLSYAEEVAPPMPPTRPYGQITAAENNLEAPLVDQWNVTVERNFGQNQMLSVAYVGNSGTRLLQTQTQPSFGDAYNILILASNGATSSYNAMQVQFRRRLSQNLQTQLSYTWGHSIDSSSTDAGGGFASIINSGQRGNSDFDIRQNLNWSGSYRLPNPRARWFTPLLRNWYTDWIAMWHTSLPFSIQGITAETSASSVVPNQTAGLFAMVRPNYTGLPVWISDPNAPGGKKLNPDAFAAPSSSYGQGDLGRNSLRGFDFSQVDITLRRQIAIREKWRLNISAEMYNLFNHPNFANPLTFGSANLSSPTFGVATQTVGGSVNGGSLYQSGGPRSVELAVRLQF